MQWRIATGVFLALPMAARAELQLGELIREALENNPEVVAARKRYEAAAQRPAQASGLPDLMFSAGYASNGRPWPGAALGLEPTSNIGFMVSQEIPAPGKRRLRAAVAQKEAQAEFLEYQGVRLGVMARMKQAYFELAHAGLALDVLERNRALVERLLRVTEARYAAGKASQQEVLKAQTQLSVLAARTLQFTRQRAAREAEVVTLSARRPATRLDKPPYTVPGPPTRSIEQLYAAAQENAPLLGRDEKRIQGAEAAVNLARRDAYPDYTLSGGYFNMGRMRDMYQFRVDFKLPAFDRRKQRAAVAEQVYALAGMRKELEAAERTAAYRIRDEYLAWETSHKLMKLYEDTIGPQSRLTLEASLAEYETGSVDFAAILMNVLSIFEYEMNYHEEMRNGHLAIARLEELTGIALAEGPNP